MTNLLTEYRQRKHIDYLPVVHDGLCFFDPKKKPNNPIVAMTSLSCRTFGTCRDCDEKSSSVTVELFQPGYGGTFMLTSHTHVDQSIDLNKYVNKQIGWPLEPFVAKSNRSLEFWLWDFCFKQNASWRPKYTETDPELKKLEEMAYVAIKQPQQYQIYYLAYEAFLLSRKYMLMQ